MDVEDHLCKCVSVDQLDVDAARESPRFLRIASGSNEETTRNFGAGDDTGEFAHRPHADGPLPPLLALNHEFLAVPAQCQIDSTVGTIDCILDD
jgi:hypothetical protein